jgi:amidase
VVGFKPTVGVINGKGIVPISPRQDTAGPMGRTVLDAALLAECMADTALGFGAYGRDIDAFRLQGVRVGMLPPARSAHPDTARLFAQARAVLEQEGARVLDFRPPAAFDDMDDPESVALRYEFKAAINLYLAGLDQAQVPCRSLADLIAFNRAHADEELVVFGQELFEAAESKGPLTDVIYQAAVADLNRTADTQGLAALFEQGAEVLIAPCNGPAELIDGVWGDRHGGGWPQIAGAAAIAGYPSITVPAGLVGQLPVGIALVGRRHQDGLLLQIARAYERAANARLPPRMSVP